MKNTANTGSAGMVRHCPCGTGKLYPDCCGRFISGSHIPGTPEELMLSRYTAYSRAEINYIAQTMKSPASDHFDAEEARRWAKKISWAGLEVLHAAQHGSEGTVEFRAYYYQGGKRHVLHEVSAFSFENGRWYYVDRQ